MDISRLTGLQQEIYYNAKTKGFWAQEGNELIVPTKLMLIDTETAEAMESFRHHEPTLHYAEDGKPEGIASELADVVIRVMDLAEHLAFDLLEVVIAKVDYNAGREHMHGGKAV